MTSAQCSICQHLAAKRHYCRLRQIPVWVGPPVLGPDVCPELKRWQEEGEMAGAGRKAEKRNPAEQKKSTAT